MSSVRVIVAAILSKIGQTECGIWRIGLTHDWAKRRSELANEGQSVAYWSCWETDSLFDAQGLESHFINRGMKGVTGGNLDSSKTVYLYVY
jgi:hypothetical protein